MGFGNPTFNLIVIQLKISYLNLLITSILIKRYLCIYENIRIFKLKTLDIYHDTKSKQNLHIVAKFCKLHEDTERKRCITQVQIV